MRMRLPLCCPGAAGTAPVPLTWLPKDEQPLLDHRLLSWASQKTASTDESHLISLDLKLKENDV